VAIDIRTLAASAVAKGFGATNAPQAMAIRRTPTTGAYNPATGTVTPGTPVDNACTGIVTTYGQREVDGTSILTTDRKVIIPQAELSISPTTADKAVIGGAAKAIIHVGQDAVGATWVLQVRG
jgi:hypothetical protein